MPKLENFVRLFVLCLLCIHETYSKLLLLSLTHPVSFPDLAAVWLLVSTAAQSQICQETIALGCGSYQQIEADETVCGSDGSHYVNL